MREFSVVSAQVLLKARAECLLTPAGILLDLDTVADCMGHEMLRPWFGRMLQQEIMPAMSPDGRDEAVIQACRYLSFKPASLALSALADGLIDAWSLHILPLMSAQTPRMIQAFAALIMLFTGVRRTDDGYCLPQERMKNVRLTRDEKALRSFSRLSWDMDAASLCYAVLADTDIWGRDLREDGFLDGPLTHALEDIQLTGLYAALTREDA